MKREEIISYMTRYWLSKGVWFGDKIHQLKPKNLNEWKQYLIQNKWFFVKGLKFKKYERRYWIHYLLFSFWKLYNSEIKAIDFFESKYNIKLEFADHALDVRTGVDFIFKYNNKTFFLIVKQGIKSFNFKQLAALRNVFLFDSKDCIIYDNNGLVVNSVTHFN